MRTEKYVIGIDFGTDSCRAIIVDVNSAQELASQTSYYPRWKKGLYCNASRNQYRQHPQDYIDTLTESVREALSQLPQEAASKVCAIGIDTTGSTPCLTDKNGVPLALLAQHAEKPDAMFILWKDHTAIGEAAEINGLAHKWIPDYTSQSGGVYSSEWFWAKALHALRNDKSLRDDAYAIVEHCDWMPSLLTGNVKPESVKRSRCAAGHKGMWAEEWGGYPSQQFLSELDSLLDGFHSRLSSTTFTSNLSAGKLTGEWAEKLGLKPGIDVSVGILDAHAGAIGAGIKAHAMVKIIGTSTCDIIATPYADLNGRLIPGISGQVDGSVIPGFTGLEAGQSAYGDIFAWFKDLLSWALPLNEEGKREGVEKILPALNEAAMTIPPSENDPVACDWFNGRRTPFANQALKSGIMEMTLGTSVPVIYKTLVEAAAFGSKKIMEHIERHGVPVREVIAVGGISLKSPFVMQTLADVLNVPIKVAKAQQAGALGAAMNAAVASGCFPSIEKAQDALGQGELTYYSPDGKKQGVYKKLYQKYLELCQFLGGKEDEVFHLSEKSL